jgi:hypothetical protein
MAQSLALFKDCTYDISVIVFDMVNSRRNRNIFETHLCLGSLEVDGLLHTCPRHGSRVARVLTFACHPTNICGCLPVFGGAVSNKLIPSLSIPIVRNTTLCYRWRDRGCPPEYHPVPEQEGLHRRLAGHLVGT